MRQPVTLHVAAHFPYGLRSLVMCALLGGSLFVLPIGQAQEATAPQEAPRAQQTPIEPDTKALLERAQQAHTQQQYLEAAVLYEALSQTTPIVTQEDATYLLSAASNYASAGQHEKAIALWDRVLTIPARPGARPPGMWSGPRDFRGIAGRGIADSYRAQGRWAEALERYRQLRATYPLDDGCVPSGVAVQQMALEEGVCLEQLGRFREAVALYWPAALHLSSMVAPVAMRRLVDLYTAAGQMEVLEAAIAHEAKGFAFAFRMNYIGRADTVLTAQQQKQWQQHLAYSALPAFDRVRTLRQAARKRQWDVLLAALQYQPGATYDTALDHEVPAWKRREAMAALVLVAPEAVPVLRRAIEQDRGNRSLQVALLLCDPRELQRRWLEQHSDLALQGLRTYEVEQIMQEVKGYRGTPLQFARLPAKLQLPVPPPQYRLATVSTP